MGSERLRRADNLAIIRHTDVNDTADSVGKRGRRLKKLVRLRLRSIYGQPSLELNCFSLACYECVTEFLVFRVYSRRWVED